MSVEEINAERAIHLIHSKELKRKPFAKPRLSGLSLNLSLPEEAYQGLKDGRRNQFVMKSWSNEKMIKPKLRSNYESLPDVAKSVTAPKANAAYIRNDTTTETLKTEFENSEADHREISFRNSKNTSFRNEESKGIEIKKSKIFNSSFKPSCAQTFMRRLHDENLDSTPSMVSRELIGEQEVKSPLMPIQKLPLKIK